MDRAADSLATEINTQYVKSRFQDIEITVPFLICNIVEFPNAPIYNNILFDYEIVSEDIYFMYVKQNGRLFLFGYLRKIFQNHNDENTHWNLSEIRRSS